MVLLVEQVGARVCSRNLTARGLLYRDGVLGSDTAGAVCQMPNHRFGYLELARQSRTNRAALVPRMGINPIA